MLSLGERAGQPIEFLAESILRWCGASLQQHEALSVAQLVESESLGDLLHLHCVGQVLLVREHEQHGVAQLILGQHAVQLLLGGMLVVLGVVDTIAIIRVDHEDDALETNKKRAGKERERER